MLKQTEEGEQRGLGAAYFKESGRQKWFSFFSYFILFSYFPLEKVYSLIVFFFGGGTPLFCGNRDEEGTSVGPYESQEYKPECEA